MINIYLFLISIGYFAFIFLFIIADFRLSSDRFSAVKLVSYFALIEAFVMLWFALSPNAISERIWAQLGVEYQDTDLVLFAYLFSVVTYFFVVVGVFFGSYFSGRTPVILDRCILNFSSAGKLVSISGGLFLYFIGVVFYLIFIHKLGGLVYLWENISLRTALSAGLGYYQSIYNFLILVGSAFLYVIFVKGRKWFFLFVMLSASFAMLASLGQRSPLALLCFILVLVHHYSIKKIPSIFNKKILLVSLGLVFFMITVVQLRPGQESVSFFDRFERDVIQRLGIIERQVVVIGYFDVHDYWYSRLYGTLLFAFLPRNFYPNKPPVDTGVYLHGIRHGEVISPPVAAIDLEPTSWPDGFLAGYMSFGFFGLITLCLVSGCLYGFIYRLLLLSDFSTPIVVLYSMMGFMGVKPLSPLGIVDFAMMVFPFFVIGLLARIRLNRV